MQPMKKIFSLLLMLATTLTSFGQQNEIKKRPIKKQDFAVKEFTVDGIKVIFKPSNKDIISAALYIKGGTTNYSKEQEGIENLTMNLLAECGSQKYPKDRFNELIDSYGTNISASSGQDQSSVNMNCLKSRWDSSWDIFADMILHPAFDENTFQNKKEEALSALHQTESDPDGHLRDLIFKDVFKNTNYYKLVDGSEASITAFKLDDIKSYYSNLMSKNKLFVVIIGNMTEDDVKAKVAMLKTIPLGTPPATTNLSKPTFDKSSLYKEDRKLATNYIEGIMDAPPVGTPDHTAMKIAMNILSDRLFVEIRTKRNLSYAPFAMLASVKIPYSAMYVSTTDPDQAVQVMTDEVKKIRKNGFTDKELRDKKEKYLTGYYMNLETNSALNATLGKNENQSSWNEVLNVLDQVNKLSLEDLNRVFRQYTTSVHWVYLGDTTSLDEKVFLQSLN